MVPASDLWLCMSFLKLLDALLDDYRTPHEVAAARISWVVDSQVVAALVVEVDPSAKQTGLTVADKQKPLLCQLLFMFALIWSVGSSSDADGRNKFDTMLRNSTDM